MGRGVAQVVTVFAFFSDDPSSNPTDVYSFSVEFMFEKTKKRPGFAHFLIFVLNLSLSLSIHVSFDWYHFHLHFSLNLYAHFTLSFCQFVFLFICLFILLNVCPFLSFFVSKFSHKFGNWIFIISTSNFFKMLFKSLTQYSSFENSKNQKCNFCGFSKNIKRSFWSTFVHQN